MRKPPRLQRRRQTWYVRVSVPEELRPAIGKYEVVRSLKTRDYKEACDRVPLASAEVNAEFAEARRRLSATPATALSDHDAKMMVLEFFWRRERAEREHEVNGAAALSRDEALLESEIDVATLADAENPNTIAGVQAEADRILEENNVRLDKGGREYALVCQLLRRGSLEGARRGRDRLDGDFSDRSYDAAFREVAADGPAPAAPEAPGLTLAELVDRYMGDPARAGVTPKTRLDYDFAFRLLMEVIGADRPARDITREDCRRVRDVLVHLPPNATKRWRDVPLSEVSAMAQERGLRPMAPRTANSYLIKLGGLMGWAQREEYVERNPAAGLRVAEAKVHARDARRPLSTEQLQKMFNAPLYTGCKDDGNGYATPGPNITRRWRFWLLPIGIYSGLRLNEICSLRVEDLERRDGVWCFVVRPHERGRLKTRSARRVVPMHPELERMGLLDYADEVRGRGEEMLFPEIPEDGRGYRSDAAQKWFSRFMSKAGAKEPKTSLHSARHSFRDQLREISAPRDVVLALGGWSSGHTADIYGGGLRPKTLNKWVRKIRYDLNLSHLHQK